MKSWFAPGFLAVLALALALRLPQLALRPLHNDEGVNAIKFRALWNDNAYKYDPNEFHGPTLPYFTLPFALLSGSHDFNDFTETTYRTVTVAFGVGLIALLLLLTRDLGRTAVGWAALFTAISPAMVFYSRYYIHEMLLVFFTALTAISWWRHTQSGKIGWAVLSGIALGLMAATKETFVFALAAMLLAAVCTGAFNRWRGIQWRLKSGVIVAGCALVVTVLFFASFFTNFAGLVDAIKTYLPWLHRAGGASPHTHEWSFYFQRLLCYRFNGGPFWTEGFVVALAVVGFTVAIVNKNLGSINMGVARFVAFYTAWLTLFYTVLPYKTPWCLLGFYHGAILLAGIGAAWIFQWCRPFTLRALVAVAMLAGSVQLGYQTWQGNFAVDPGGVPYCDSAKNPYVYSQTVPDIRELVETIEAVAKVAPSKFDTPIEVISPDSYWPLPWYLRRFTHAGYWDKIPDQPLAPIMIVSADLHAGFDERPNRTHLMHGYYQLRPGLFYELYFNLDLWTDYLKTLPKQKAE